MLHRTAFVLAVWAVAIVPTSLVAQNQYNYQHSSWRTMYITPNGNAINAELAFNGLTGTYKAGNLDGKLKEINYDSGPTGTTITGIWSANNSSGSFKFTIANNNPNQFNGTYTLNNITKSWNGSLGYGFKPQVTKVYWSKDINKNRYYCRCYFRKNNGGYDYCYCCYYPTQNKYYWCTRTFSWWGRCGRFGGWRQWQGNWNNWNSPRCPGCPWICWCYPPPPPPDDDTGIPAGIELNNANHPPAF